MTTKKKSFFEKITGIRKVEDEEQEIAMSYEEQPQDQPYAAGPAEYPQEDNYEFPPQAGDQAGRSQKVEYEDYEQYENGEDLSGVTQQPSPSAEAAMEAEGQLTIDVYQTDEDIVIKSTIAGVKPEDLDVNINNDMVTIRGERKQDEDIDPESYYYQECYWGPFSRSVILPVEIISDKAEANMKNGILTIKLPKADTTKTRRIQVRGY